MNETTSSERDDLFQEQFALAKQTYDNDPSDLSTCMKQLRAALKLNPKHKEAKLLLDLLKYYNTDLSFARLVNAYELAYKNHSADFNDVQFFEYISYLICCCEGEIKEQKEKLDNSHGALKHEELDETLGTISLCAKALSSCDSLITERFGNEQTKPIQEQLEALKLLSLCYSMMFKRYKCSDCGHCEASVWKIDGNLPEIFATLNARIKALDPSYIPPAVSGRAMKTMASNIKGGKTTQPRTIKDKIKGWVKGALCVIPLFALSIILFAVSHASSEEAQDALSGASSFVLFLSAIWLIICILRISSLKKKKNAFCPKCGKKYTKDDIVGIKKVGSRTLPNAIMSTVAVVTKCKDCGENQFFTKEVCVVRIDDNGWVEKHTEEEAVIEYIKYI